MQGTSAVLQLTSCPTHPQLLFKMWSATELCTGSMGCKLEVSGSASASSDNLSQMSFVLWTVVFVDHSFSGSRVATPFAGGVRSSMCKSETYVLDASFNPEEFVEDIKKAKAAVGEATEEDAQHLQRLVLISQVLLYGGHILLLAGAAVPWGLTTLLLCATAAFMIAYARCMKWAIIGHHVSHGGFDSLQKNRPNALPKHYKRGVFAIGFRRFLDWCL